MGSTQKQKPDVAQTQRQGGGVQPQAKRSALSSLFSFLRDDIDFQQLKYDETDFLPKQQRVLGQIRRQAFIIAGLVVFIVVAAPFIRPINIHQAMAPAPEKTIQPLIALSEPNLTDQAILSWVATGITEILTFGFGDFDRRIEAQKNRFTSIGWKSFLESLRKQDLREEFKMRQLVLTTVPSNTPVIVAKGIDEDEDEIWTVEMPIVMTYMTNNDVKQVKKNIVRLTLARVPAKENRAGIGIKEWKMM